MPRTVIVPSSPSAKYRYASDDTRYSALSPVLYSNVIKYVFAFSDTAQLLLETTLAGADILGSEKFFFEPPTARDTVIVIITIAAAKQTNTSIPPMLEA